MTEMLSLFSDAPAITAAALAALVGGFAFILRERHRRKRSARKVLYHLLKFHWTFQRQRHSFDNIQQAAKRICHDELRRLNLLGDPHQIEQIWKVISELTKPFYSQISKTLDYPVEPFLRDLNDLAYDYPIVAYKLKGTEQIVTQHSHLSDHLKDLSGLAEEMEKFTSPLIEQSGKWFGNSLDRLRSDILSLSIKSSWVTYLQVRIYTLPRAELDLATIENDPELEELLSELRKSFIHTDFQESEKPTIPSK